MSMTISNQSSVSPAIPRYGKGHIKDQAATFKTMQSDIASGDMEGAKAAYVSLAKNAPASAKLNPNGPFAQLGKALQSGDVSGAQAALSTLVQDVKARGTSSVPPTTGAPVSATPSSTGGVAGSTLNVTA